MYTYARDLLPFYAYAVAGVCESSFSQHEAHPPPKEELDVFSRNTFSVAFIPRIREFPRWVRRPADI